MMSAGLVHLKSTAASDKADLFLCPCCGFEGDEWEKDDDAVEIHRAGVEDYDCPLIALLQPAEEQAFDLDV